MTAVADGAPMTATADGAPMAVDNDGAPGRAVVLMTAAADGGCR